MVNTSNSSNIIMQDLKINILHGLQFKFQVLLNFFGERENLKLPNKAKPRKLPKYKERENQ